MTRGKITLLCLPVALVGLGVSAHATLRVRLHERELSELDAAGRQAGAAFVSTLKGEHAERQRAAFDRRLEVALALAGARRDQLLGVVAAATSGLLAAGLSALGRISSEIEADRRHLQEQGVYRRPDRS
jgi:hypothetical protein